MTRTASAIGETLVSAEDLQRRVAELGAEISRDYEGRDLVLVGVLKGAVLFLADLMRHLTVPCELDFMAVSSYGSRTDSSGVVRILKDLDAPIEGRDVLIVEDIIDSGLTLHYLLREPQGAQSRLARGLRAADQARAAAVDLPIRYVGFEIPNRFAIGYGLDHEQHFRNLDYVAPLAEKSRRRGRIGAERRAGGARGRAETVAPWYPRHKVRRLFRSAFFPIVLVLVLAFFAPQ